MKRMIGRFQFTFRNGRVKGRYVFVLETHDVQE